MVANIIAAFHKRIEAALLDGSQDQGRSAGEADTLYVGIGYPETWIDYSAYEVRPTISSAMSGAAELFEYHRQVDRLGTPVDSKSGRWMPQTVNAVNLPLQNALNFPAAILQPPFFDPQAPAAHNYGAIGTVIGHEISHTFDTEGAAFDSTGPSAQLVDARRSRALPGSHGKARSTVRRYQPFPDLHLNGKQTLAKTSPMSPASRPRMTATRPR